MSAVFKHIPLLIPDMPNAEQLLPWLRKVDQNSSYTNFGPLVKEFEIKLAKEISRGRDQAVASSQLCTTANGSTALSTAILALNLPAPGNILVPAFTFPGSALAVMAAGHKPVFTDVDPASWSLNPEQAAAIVRTQKIDVVMPVAALGNPIDCKQWDKFYADTSVPFIVDSAAAFANQEIGMHGIYTFSFHATKVFGIGEGGLIVCRDAELVQECRERSNFGFRRSLIHRPGHNAKMSEYHAAVGLAQLDRWQSVKKKRSKLWKAYVKRTQVLGPAATRQLCYLTDGRVNSTFNLTFAKPAELIAAQLNQENIETRRWYCPGLHRHPALEKFALAGPDTKHGLPNTDYLNQFNLGLPFHNKLSDDDLDRILEALVKVTS